MGDRLAYDNAMKAHMDTGSAIASDAVHNGGKKWSALVLPTG